MVEMQKPRLPAAANQFAESRLVTQKRQSTQVFTIQPQQVERIEERLTTMKHQLFEL